LCVVRALIAERRKVEQSQRSAALHTGLREAILCAVGDRGRRAVSTRRPRATRRPNLTRELAAFRADMEIDGLSRMAQDFIRAGYPGSMYYQLLNGWIHYNRGVPDEFFSWLDRTYGVSDSWAPRCG
jgi:hypothetical protein